MLFRGLAAALLCLWCVAAGRAAELAADPMLLPKTLLALRGDNGPATQLQLVFDRNRDGVDVAPLTVWLGADYFVIADGERLTVTDLKLRRRFVIDRQEGTLVNSSLYGDAMFRRVELVRRQQIATALAKEPSHPAIPDGLQRFWIESELGILAEGKPLPLEEPHQKGDSTSFRHDGRTIATVTPGDTAIPGRLAHSYRVFLHRTLPLHPSIATWLGELGRVPARLDFTSEAKGREEQISLRLSSAKVAQAAFPLPPRLSLVLLPWGANDPDVALMRRILPRITQAVTEPAALDRVKAVAAARAAIDRDFDEGHKFAAALQLTELALRWGRAAAECDNGAPAGAPCRSRGEIDRLLRDDSRSVTMFKATALQQREPAKALALWRELDRDGVPDGYVVDLFMAPLLSQSEDRPAAAAAFAAAFAGDARIPLLYRELGDHFARISRLDLAWLCYDLGRALPNRSQPDALSSIDGIEQNLAEAYPDLF